MPPIRARPVRQRRPAELPAARRRRQRHHHAARQRADRHAGRHRGHAGRRPAQAPAARRPHHAHQRHHRHGRQPGLPHPGVWRVPLPVRCAERVRADRHVGLHQSDAGRQQTLPPLYRRRHRRWPTAAACCRPPTCAAPSGAACSSVRPGPHPLHRQEPQAGPRQRRVRLRPGRRHRRWRLRGGAAGRGRAHPLSRPGFVGRPVGRGQGPRRQRRRGHPGALLVPGRHVCRGPLRSGRMRGSYTDDIDGSTNYRSRSNYWGPTPCWAM